jgi:hypothetical protein
MASGATNIGFFKLWTTEAFIDCKWPGNTLSKSPQIEVRVVSEDGVTQVSTNQVSHKDGKIFVFASGFHYSSPTIKLVAVGDSAPVSSGSQSTPTPTSTPVPTAPAKPAKPSVTTIKCLKGKTLKKVSAVSPKCPTGFKLTK